MVITVIKKTVINSSAHHLGRCLAAIVWLVRILKWVWLKQRSRNVVFFFVFFPPNLCTSGSCWWTSPQMCFAAYAEGKHQLLFAISASAMRSSTPTPLTSKTGSHKRACHRSDTTLIRNTRSTWMYPGFFFVVVGGFFLQQSSVCLRPPLQSWRRRPGLQTPQLPIQSSIHGMSRIKCSPQHTHTHNHTPPHCWITWRQSSAVQAARGHRAKTLPDRWIKRSVVHEGVFHLGHLKLIKQ